MKMKFIHITTLLFCTTFFFLSACNPDRQGAEDDKDIRDFLKDNNLQAEKTESGLYYIIDVPGSSEHPMTTDSVVITYTGSLLNGDVFDSSLSATFLLDDLIQGLIEGIPLLGKGGEGRFFIPSGLGYGGFSQPGIPANAILIFEVKLIDF